MTSQASGPVFTPLSTAWKEAVERLFEEGDPKREWPVSTYYNSPLTSGVLARDLKPHQWLSDDVLNGYVTVLQNAFNHLPTKRFACCNTQFLAQLGAAKGHMPWQKFTGGVDKSTFASFHLIFVLVHQGGNHWNLITINPRARLATQYDSLVSSRKALREKGSKGLRQVSSWLESMLGPAAASWTYLVAENTIEQPNSYDCGICVLVTMRLLMGGHKGLGNEKAVSEVTQLLADMRLRVAAEIMAGEINPRDVKVPFAA